MSLFQLLLLKYKLIRVLSKKPPHPTFHNVEQKIPKHPKTALLQNRHGAAAKQSSLPQRNEIIDVDHNIALQISGGSPNTGKLET